MSNTHTIHVMSDPESKIRFLETTLDGQDWRAKLVFAPNTHGLKHAHHTAQQLRERGYLVDVKRDDEGHVIVDAHSTGHDTDWLGLFSEYGLIKGATHTIQNPLLPLDSLRSGGRDMVDKTKQLFSNPVRLGSISYIAADTAQTLTGLFNPDAAKEATSLLQKAKNKAIQLRNPKNWTQSLGGALFLTQSIMYLKYAKTGTELSVEDMNKAYTRAEKEGKDLKNVDGWTQDIGKDKKRITPKVFRDYPIQSGAVIQNTGMALLFAHMLLEWRYKKGLLKSPSGLSAKDLDLANKYVNKGGFMLDAYRTVASFTGWALLLYPVKNHEQKSDNIVERAFQSFEENPQHVSSAIATSTSLAGAVSGMRKNNFAQMLGETLYLPGDLLLSQANNARFGKNDAANEEAIVEAVQQFITRSPMVLGPDARQEFACAIAEQLLKQSAAIALEKAKPEEREALETKIEDSRASVIHELCNGTSLEDARYNTFIESVRHLVVRFPAQQRAAVAAEIAEHLVQIPSVYVTTEEMHKDLAIDALPPSVNHAQAVMHIEELSPDIRALSNVIPSENAGDVAALLYDSLNGIIHGQSVSNHIQASTAQTSERLHPITAQLTT